MIKRITIRDVASYDHKGVTFNDLAKVNFIFGGNGTGKTTIGRVLTEEHKDWHYPNCNIDWVGKNDNVRVLAYNADFKEESLQETMPGVFTLGEGWAAAEDRLINEYIPMAEDYIKNNVTEENKEQLLRLKEDLWQRFYHESFYRPSVDFINGMLKEYGFTNFSIQLSPEDYRCYQIQREDGSFVFKSLSEGEITFITFLYFFQLVTTSSSEIENEKKIIAVIDDPISSLDAHAMSVASLLVRQLINQARQPDENRHVQQVIVLTHNLEFFKQVAPRQGRTDTHYWRLLKKGNVSHAIDCGNNRPVRSGYEHLWEELREESYKLDSTRLQNLMRSIIETYFLLFGDYNKQKAFQWRLYENA